MNNQAVDELLRISTATTFGGTQSDFEGSGFVILGAPLDSTGTFRVGYREAPIAIRSTSSQIEQYSSRFMIDASRAKVHDVGDLVLGPDPSQAVDTLEQAIRKVREKSKIPIILGGEHTITLGAFIGSGADRLIVFDAHLDARDEYLFSRLSHTTWLRRLVEKIGYEKMLHIGFRATSEDEMASGLPPIEIVPASLLLDRKFDEVRNRIRWNSSYYLSIDMDVFDPAYAPGVGNPEPEGISPTILFDLFKELKELNIVAFDICEVIPKYDPSGITSILASKVVLEFICSRIA